MLGRKLLIDIGSTYTKAIVVDLERECILASAKALTTVATGIDHGVAAAIASVTGSMTPIGREDVIACSSAAGGLRMISVGLIPEYSAEAAKRAALGAGAKIVGQFCHQLSRTEIVEIEALDPDIILLAGGTDGGNDKVILHNAAMLAQSGVTAPIIVAGNKCAQDAIAQELLAAGKVCKLVGNVMPDIGRLEVDSCRQAIREVFIANIVKAKGLDRAEILVGNLIMATPAAVMAAATLLSQGSGNIGGMGELVVIDVGGATTDVYSVANSAPVSAAVVLRGLPEPYAKRTVEGDLGVRHNIATLQALGQALGLKLNEDAIAAFAADPSRLPGNEAERQVDTELARLAVKISFDRHVGRLEASYGPHGEILLQTGKNLSEVRTVIGTGGPLAHASDPAAMLKNVLADSSEKRLLKPEAAEFYVDSGYSLYAMGLLAQTEPQIALRIMKRGLRRV